MRGAMAMPVPMRESTDALAACFAFLSPYPSPSPSPSPATCPERSRSHSAVASLRWRSTPSSGSSSSSSCSNISNASSSSRLSKSIDSSRRKRRNDNIGVYTKWRVLETSTLFDAAAANAAADAAASAAAHAVATAAADATVAAAAVACARHKNAHDHTQRHRRRQRLVACRAAATTDGHAQHSSAGIATPARQSIAQSAKEQQQQAAAAVATELRTGGALPSKGATEALVGRQLVQEKRVVLVRHGLSTWNDEGRVQGSSDGSTLAPLGELQALRCREALKDIPFDCCFASPISRARRTAELMWQDRTQPLVFAECLREANLLFLEGMLNSDAKAQYPELFGAWRNDPANFNVDGVYPVRNLWDQAREAWRQILEQEGSTVLVVTHKSLLRALICTALGLGPDKFRAMDVNNGGICVVRVNVRGEPMLEALNLTSHLVCDGVHYQL